MGPSGEPGGGTAEVAHIFLHFQVERRTHWPGEACRSHEGEPSATAGTGLSWKSGGGTAEDANTSIDYQTIFPIESSWAAADGGEELEGSISFLFTNTTSWGQQTWDHLNQDGGGFSSSDTVMIAEHHLQGPHHVQAIKRLNRCGWSATSQGAAGTARGGFHGGAWLMTRNWLQHSPLYPEVERAVQDERPTSMETQWTSQTVRMRDIDVVFVTLHLVTGLGLQGEQAIILGEVAGSIRSQGKPSIIAGDRDMEIDEVAESGIHTCLHGVFRAAPEEAPGGAGTIGCCLCSEALSYALARQWDPSALTCDIGQAYMSCWLAAEPFNTNKDIANGLDTLDMRRYWSKSRKFRQWSKCSSKFG
ncbi:unnamed protein product [Prorocentrum cordatum]|uniref:Uncharacterized protein n=1 Tax=Prorocentrum cordatum TaxID=2364126 RepID=A0ABN9V594_9DINO|nr:unnamed protein product [Polarella glacialis]